MRLSLRKLEYTWHAAAFILLMGAFVPLWRRITTGGVDIGAGDPVQRIFLGMAYLGILLLFYNIKTAWLAARKEWLLWLLIGWAMLSTLWSALPDVTLRRSIAAVLASLYGLMLAVRYRPDEVLRMLGLALAIVVISSFVAIIFFPEWAIMYEKHHGSWRGVFTHRNGLGRVGALALIMFWVLSLITRHQTRRLYWYALMIMAGILVMGSGSATGLILALTVPAGWVIIKSLSSLSSSARIAAGSLMFGIAILGTMVLPDILEALLILLGRDPTLTGRIPLWNLLLSFALERPILGYGYGAFWVAEGPSSMVWAMTWDAPHAHNGYLDMLLELGLVGVFLCLIILISITAQNVVKIIQMPKSKFLLAMFFFSMFFVLANCSESVFLESGLSKAIYWVILSYYIFARSSLQNKDKYHEY